MFTVDEDYGKLVNAAHGLDTSWAPDGRCFNWPNRPGEIDDPYERGPLKPTPWHVSHDQSVDGVSGRELQSYARMICAGCPAQWDCAIYAVRGVMLQGTWGMRIGLLKKLHKMEEAKPGSAIALIEAARIDGTPVQFIKEPAPLT